MTYQSKQPQETMQTLDIPPLRCIGCVRTQKSTLWSLIVTQSTLRLSGLMAKQVMILSGV